MPVESPVAQPTTTVSPEAPEPAPVSLPVVNVKPPFTVPPAVQDKDHEEHVQERVAELTALAMNDDTNSLNTIWSELANPDKEIRAGALAAVVQFGDHSVVPRLRELAAQTPAATEKADIIEAADFLELPSLTDLPRARPRAPKPGQPPK